MWRPRSVMNRVSVIRSARYTAVSVGIDFRSEVNAARVTTLPMSARCSWGALAAH